MNESTRTTYEENEQSAPTTPGQSEGSADIDEQSETSPAPTQINPAEGVDEGE
jgi:hypothetical protein